MDFKEIGSDLNFQDKRTRNEKKTLSVRDRNEMTASLIKKQIGSIEQVRTLMGLNKRKMCELLLIDPSTWTRWTTGKTEPPTWVYRTLQWGLAVMDKHPEFHPLVTRQGVGKSEYKESKSLKKLMLEVDSIKKDLRTWTCLAFGSLFFSLLLVAYILNY